jgi:putative methylase
MGEHAQKRIIRKLDLERFLSKIAPQPSPQVRLEQYTTSEPVAATLLYVAAFVNDDVVGKSVLDLGCGTGRLSLGAAFLGAQEVVGVDIDKRAIETAAQNSRNLDLEGNVQWVIGDIKAVSGKFDTVLQNPPFGVQIREADRAFLVKALESGKSVYSLHNHPETDNQLVIKLKASGGFFQVQPSPFLEQFIAKHGGNVKAVYAILMTIPRLFVFHKEVKHDFVVDLYVIEASKP